MSVHRFRPGDELFRDAIDAMTSAPLLPELVWRTIPAPSRMAPSTWACTAEILAHDEELASGRLVILHDPEGQEAWDGTFRMVALVQAQLEPEFAIESMLGDVAWSWVTESLELHDADARELGCTATRVVSQSYGALASRPSTVDVEMRISWTPEPPEPPEPPERPDPAGPPASPAAPETTALLPDLAAAGVPDLGPHFAAWTAMLAAAGGLPPAPPRVSSLVPTHRARAPRPSGEEDAR